MYYLYGIDPASAHDFFGIVVHEMSTFSQMPRLRTLRKITGVAYTEVLNILENGYYDKKRQWREGLFKVYPPFHISIDYTNERTFTDILVAKKGKEKVEKVPFSDINKQMLKEDGLFIMRSGYAFPSLDAISDDDLRAMVKDVIDELRREQFEPSSKEGINKFYHPPGKHNDMAHSWELSVHSCLKFMLKGKSKPAGYSKGSPVKTGYQTPELDHFKELRRKGIHIRQAHVVSGDIY